MLCLITAGYTKIVFLFKNMDFSFLNDLPNANDVPDNHPNLPYLMFEIITGKIGSGKTHLAFSQVLKPGFIDYQQFYLVSPELSKK